MVVVVAVCPFSRDQSVFVYPFLSRVFIRGFSRDRNAALIRIRIRIRIQQGRSGGTVPSHPLSASYSPGPTFHAQNGPSLKKKKERNRTNFVKKRGGERWGECGCSPSGSPDSCSAPVHMPMTPMAEPRPPSCTPSLAHSPSPSSRNDTYCMQIHACKDRQRQFLRVQAIPPPPPSSSGRTGTHKCPAYIARGGHLHGPAYACEFGRRSGGVPFACDVDCRSAGPGCGRARVVRDAERERDDAHHFVQRWIAEARFERLVLYSVGVSVA
jgi:hypothetical protein